MRLDMALVRFCGVKSRERAQKLIAAGFVSVNGTVVKKNSADVTEQDCLTVSEELPYVGRGGQKLARALDVFCVSCEGVTALDVGVSTGGFTDCMLQNGATLVYAVDVGHDQLDPSLRADSRVVSLERTHIRDLTSEQVGTVDLITVDTSFISLKQVLPHCVKFLKEDGILIALLKPQFEAGRTKKGIVTDFRVHVRVMREVLDAASEIGLFCHGATWSPIRGDSGNIEYLLDLRKKVAQTVISPDDTVRLCQQHWKECAE